MRNQKLKVKRKKEEPESPPSILDSQDSTNGNPSAPKEPNLPPKFQPPNPQPPSDKMEEDDLPDISQGLSSHFLPQHQPSLYSSADGQSNRSANLPHRDAMELDFSGVQRQGNGPFNLSKRQVSLKSNESIKEETKSDESSISQSQNIEPSRSLTKRSIPKLLQFPQITPVRSDGISKRTDISLLKPYVKSDIDFEYLQLTFSQVRGIGSSFNMNLAFAVAYYDYLMIPAFKAENNKIAYEISLGKDIFQTYQNPEYKSAMQGIRDLLSLDIKDVSKLWENYNSTDILRSWFAIISQNYLYSAEAKELFDQTLGDEMIDLTIKEITASIFEPNTIPYEFLFKIFSNSLRAKIKVFKSTDRGIVKEAYEPVKENSYPVLNFYMMTDPEVKLYILYSKKMVFLDGYDASSGIYNHRKIENPHKYLFSYKRQIDDNSKIREEELKSYESALKLESKIVELYDRNIVSLYNKLKDSNVKLDPKETKRGVIKIQQQVDLIKAHLKPEFIEKLELNNLVFIKLTDEVIHEIVKTCCYCNREQGVWKSPCEHYYCSVCIHTLIQPNKFESFFCAECEDVIIELKDLSGFSEYSQLKDEYLKAHNRYECRSCHKEQDLGNSQECPKCKKNICFYCLQKYVVSKRREIQNFQAEIKCNVCEESVFIGVDNWLEKCETCTAARNILDFYEFECKPGENTHGLLCRMCWSLCYNEDCAICNTPVSYNANMIIANENKIWCPMCQQTKLVYLGEKMCMSGNCVPCHDCQDPNPDMCVICGGMMQDKNSEYGYNLWIRLN